MLEQSFVLLDHRTLTRYNAESFPEQPREEPVRLKFGFNDQLPGLGTGVVIQRAVQPTPEVLVVEASFDSNYTSSTPTVVFDFKAGTLDQTLTPMSGPFTQQCRHFVGSTKGSETIVFLHRSGWISSFEAQSSSANHYTQHFFISNEYVRTGQEALLVKTVDSDVVFCLHGELLAVKNGMRF